MFGDKLNEIMDIKEVIMSTSYKNVIRGLHYQKQPYEIKKFVTCVYGEILDVFVNLDLIQKIINHLIVLNLTVMMIKLF
ncbi:hypothetical protein CM15mP35_04680 [bacterium]|nr:MAG: hypothetical protein CM15mV39_0990 [uncultured marine virus]GIR20207.1 MAG: hypothetical protein CM15mP35_04680 [bacterium]